MKTIQTKIFFILFSFVIVSILSEDIPDLGYNEFELQPGVTELIYHIPENILNEGIKYPFIGFTFSEDNIECIFKEIYNKTNEDEIEIIPIILPKNEWYTLSFNQLKNEETFPSGIITFELNNTNEFAAKMILIDNSKDIKIDLEQFLNWNYKLIYYDENEINPTPLIFSIDEVDNDTSFNIYPNDEDKILDDDHLMYYCIKNDEDSDCQYEPFTSLTVEKGQSYKFKLNCLISNIEEYYFYIPFHNYDNTSHKVEINELDFGISNLIFKNTTEKYYIVKSTGLPYILAFADHSDKTFLGYNFINESQKDNLDEEITNFEFIEMNCSDLIIFDNKNQNDYLIMKIIIDNRNYGFIILFNSYIPMVDFKLYDLEEGSHTLLLLNFPGNKTQYYLTSTNKNMALIDQETFIPKISTKELTFEENDTFAIVYVNSSKENTTINYSYYEEKEEEYEEEEYEEEYEDEFEWKIRSYSQQELDDLFNNSQNCIFSRYYSYSFDLVPSFEYYYDFDEKYYFYLKNYFGGIEFYFNNNTNIDSIIQNKDFKTLFQSYGTKDNLLINNKLVTFYGNQLISYFNYYDSLYDLYIQKYNDSETISMIQTDKSSLFNNNNLQKLFNANKTYTLNFPVDHFIKLDNNFLDAKIIFTDEKGKNYELSKDNKVIKNLAGNNIKVISNQNALVYFYQKLNDASNVKVIEFDKNKSGQNMKFEISSPFNNKLLIAKDFGFEECYPFISSSNMDYFSKKKSKKTIYIDNFYDKKLENELYEKEGEKFLIYIFGKFDEKDSYDFKDMSITEPEYYPNLLTKGNKYNFEVIPGNTEGSIIRNALNKRKAIYQIYPCENLEVKLKIKNSNGKIDYQKIFNEDSQFDSINLRSNSEILEHSFESEKEFLFSYSFRNKKIEKANENESFNIKSIDELSRYALKITFSQKYTNCTNQYHIIVAKIDQNNNKETFSNPCHIGKLMTQNSESIVVKTIYEQSNDYEITSYININKLNVKKNDLLIITVVSFNVLYNNDLSFYEPKEFKLYKSDEIIEFNIGETLSFDYEEKNLFNLNYQHKGDSALNISFVFETYQSFNFYFIDEDYNIEKYNIDKPDGIYHLVLTFTKSGNYHFLFELYDYTGNHSEYFYTYLQNEIIDTIDLSKKVYNYDKQIASIIDLAPRLIKVQNLKQDTFVFLNYTILDKEASDYENPFEICIDDESEECVKQVNLFRFYKKNNYTIKINFIKRKDEYYSNYYINPTFSFYTIPNAMDVTKHGQYSFEDTQLLLFNLTKKDNLYLTTLESKETYISYLDKSITLNNINSAELSKINSDIETISDYGLIVIFPENNNFKTKIIFADKLIKDRRILRFKLFAGENAIIYLAENETEKNKASSPKLKAADEEEEEYKYDEDYDDEIRYYTLTTFSSPVKNMELFTKYSSGDKKDLIVQNTIPIKIYVEEYEKDITIKINTYDPKFAYFLAINDNALLKTYLDLFERYLHDKKEIGLKDLLPLYIRINSDLNVFYDFVNLYFSDIKEKIILYIKKYYGGTELYECDAELKEESDYSLITKPLPTCENKKSIFNRIIRLEDIKLLSGYLGPNSYFDIYLDIDEYSENKIISPTFGFIEGVDEMEFSVSARYLEKDIEYTLNLTGKHMAKLESGFDAEVEIYNENKKVILNLNPSKLTGEFEGEKLKIKSKNNAMVYFYGQLNSEIKQIEIDPNQIGKNYKFQISKKSLYVIDFGFEGYNYVDLVSFVLQGDEDEEDDNEQIKEENEYRTIYIENIYDKFTENLVEGEKLYLYYIDNNEEINIDYSNTNINPPYNDYTFNVISKSGTNKNLVINNININKIQFQVNYCTSKKPITIYYQSIDDPKETSIKLNQEEILMQELNGPTGLRFESEEDFVFTYSFIDKHDETFSENKKWNNERVVVNDLNIEITEKNNSDLHNIKFNVNYRNSSTRYIVVIAPKNEKYTKETFSNPCIITKLVTEKSKEVKIIEFVDIGENEFINFDFDFHSIPGKNHEYIIGIISQELRFSKKINFYEPVEILTPIDFNKEEKQEFDLSTTEFYFAFHAEKKTKYNEMLLLHYKLEKSGSFIIEIYGPKGNKESFKINNEEGYVNFLYDKNGIYKIIFKNEESQLLRSAIESSIKGTFEIFTTETPFDLDLNNDNIEFKEFNINDANEPSLKFNIKTLDKDYTKKISISNCDSSNINEIVLINQNNLGDKELNFTYYTFENNSNYHVTIKFKSKEENSYTLGKVNILDYPLIEYKQIVSGTFMYNDNNDRFFIIDWTNVEKVTIKKLKYKPILLHTEITKDQSENLIKELNNLKFGELKDLTLTKPEKSNYSVLMIGPEEGTQINLKVDNIAKNIDDGDGDDDDGISAGVVIIIVIVLNIVIIGLIFIIGYFRKRRENIDFQKKTEDIQQETLLKDF